MRCLLDTHTFLWAALDSAKLSPEALSTIEEPTSELLLSSVSLWEIGILQSLKRIQLKLSIREIAQLARTELGVEIAGIEPEHIDRMRQLPFHHRDPFDRLLAGQALHLKAALVGRDEAFDAYGVRRIW